MVEKQKFDKKIADTSLSTFSVVLDDYFFQMACLQVSAKPIFSVNQLYYVILQSFFFLLFNRFSGSRFLRVRVQGLESSFRSSPTLVRTFSYVEEEKI